MCAFIRCQAGKVNISSGDSKRGKTRPNRHSVPDVLEKRSGWRFKYNTAGDGTAERHTAHGKCVLYLWRIKPKMGEISGGIDWLREPLFFPGAAFVSFFSFLIISSILLLFVFLAPSHNTFAEHEATRSKRGRRKKRHPQKKKKKYSDRMEAP
jgi:hypothetical protein